MPEQSLVNEILPFQGALNRDHLFILKPNPTHEDKISVKLMLTLFPVSGNMLTALYVLSPLILMTTPGLILKLNLQSFGHLMQTADSLEKTLLPGKIEGKGRRGWQWM